MYCDDELRTVENSSCRSRVGMAMVISQPWFEAWPVACPRVFDDKDLQLYDGLHV